MRYVVYFMWVDCAIPGLYSIVGRCAQYKWVVCAIPVIQYQWVVCEVLMGDPYSISG